MRKNQVIYGLSSLVFQKLNHDAIPRLKMYFLTSNLQTGRILVVKLVIVFEV